MCIFFDWSGTLAYPGTRETFVYSKNKQTQLGTLKKGALLFLEKLSKGYPNVRLGIISNTTINPADFKRAIHETGLDRYFSKDLIFLSGDFCNKPCDYIFDTAASVSKCEEQVFMIGDNWKHDIEPALKRGWEVLFKEKYSEYF